jgi:hypothetical protein
MTRAFCAGALRLIWLLAVSTLVIGVAAGVGKDVAVAKESGLTLPKGARIGVLNLLDLEVTHFHTGDIIAQTFLKTYVVPWRIDVMLLDSVRQRLGQLGLVAVPLAAGVALERGRDEFFVNNSVAKGLPFQCAAELARLAASEHVDALIVLAPGLNTSSQAGSGSRRRDLPEYLRGWGFVTKTEGSDKPTLFDITQVLLVGLTSDGATLSAREWGGGYSAQWADYVPPPDLKLMPAAELDQLQPLFAALLTQQSGRVLEKISVSP